MIKKELESKGFTFIWLMLPCHSSSSQEVRARTPAEQEPGGRNLKAGTQAEAMDSAA